MLQRLLTIIIIFILASIPLYSQQSLKNAERLNKQAEMAYEQKKYFSALNLYRSALKENPNYKDANVGIGKTYYKIQNYSKSLNYFKKAESQFSNDYKIKLWLAKVRLAQNRYDSAESYLQKALEIQSKDSELYIIYGDIFYKRNLYRKAIQQYEESLAINPNNELANIKIGQSYQKLNEASKALAYFQQAENLDNKNYLNNYYLGKYYYQQNEYENSEIYLRTALDLQPTHIPSLELLSQSLYQMEKWNNARDVLEKLVAMKPKNKHYYYHLGLTYDQLKMPTKSLDILLDGINLDRGDEALRYQAEHIYHKYYWSNPEVRVRGAELAEYWFRIGKNYYGQNLTDYAIFSYRRGIRLNPSHWKMRYELAKIYQSRGFTNIYFDELKIIKELNPNNQKIDDELLFADRAMKRILSSRVGIDQYAEPAIRPKIALLYLDSNQDFAHHYAVEQIFREILFTTLKMKDRLLIIMVEPQQNFKNEEQVAKEQNADFFIRGSVKESGEEIHVTLNISNMVDGEIYTILKTHQRGNRRLLDSAMYLSNKMERLFPIFGQITRKNYKEIYINVGKRHGYKAGDIFYIIPNENALNSLITNKNLPQVVSSQTSLKKILLSFIQNEKFGLEEIQITDIDENISKTNLMTSDFFNEVTVNDYVIYKPKR